MLRSIIVKKLHLYSFKLHQQVLYFNKRRFLWQKKHQAGHVMYCIGMLILSLTEILRAQIIYIYNHRYITDKYI